MGISTLLFQSFAMGVSSFFVGLAPLMFSSVASGKRLKMASTFGMGLLVGASLIVVIPEGVSTIYSSAVQPSTSGLAASVSSTDYRSTAEAVIAKVVRSSVLPGPTPVPPITLPVRDDHDHDDDDDDDDDDDHHRHSHGNTHGSDPTEAIGLSLLSGFVLMMFIEQFTHSPSASSHHHHHRGPSDELDTSPTPSQPVSPSHLDAPIPASSPTTSSAPLLSPNRPSSSTDRPTTWHSLQRRPSEGPASGSDDGNRGRRSEDEEDREESEGLIGRAADKVAGGGPAKGGSDHAKSFSATLGLVIHSAADGIALGASARSGKAGLGLVVFLAILIHKIPASLGLCTTLLSDSLPRHLIRQRIALFSSAAPVGAIVTYGLVNLLAGGIEQSLLMWWTGVALLFSGGTFLYVIATVLQDLNPAEGEEAGVSRRARMALVLAGMGSPVFLSRLAGHHH